MPPVSAEQRSAPDRMQERVREVYDDMRATVDRHDCVMYSTTVCPWCTRASDYLQKNFGKRCRKIELDLLQGDERVLGSVVAKATQQRTVPNIFITGMHVGGFESLVSVAEKCQSGWFDAELKAASAKGDAELKDPEVQARYRRLCGFFKGL